MMAYRSARPRHAVEGGRRSDRAAGPFTGTARVERHRFDEVEEDVGLRFADLGRPSWRVRKLLVLGKAEGAILVVEKDLDRTVRCRRCVRASHEAVDLGNTNRAALHHRIEWGLVGTLQESPEVEILVLEGDLPIVV